MVTLKAYTRRISAQLLGFPPEHVHKDWAADLKASGERLQGDPKRDEKPKELRKPRQKKIRGEKAIDSPNVPLLQQYQEAKERHPGMLLLFRVGDFFELFDQDAEVAAKALGLTLTSRDKTTSMAGFPHHQLENYLKKLLQAGYRVAVCDQVVDAASARDGVTRIVTPAVAENS